MRRAASLGEREARGPRPRKPRHRFKRLVGNRSYRSARLANSESTVSLPDAFALIGTQAGCFIRSDLFGTGNAGLIHSRMERSAAAPLRCMLSLIPETLPFLNILSSRKTIYLTPKPTVCRKTSSTNFHVLPCGFGKGLLDHLLQSATICNVPELTM